MITLILILEKSFLLRSGIKAGTFCRMFRLIYYVTIF